MIVWMRMLIVYLCYVFSLLTYMQLTLLPAKVFCDVSGNAGGRGKITPGHISSSRAACDKIPAATPMFSGVTLSSNGTSDFVGHQCVLEIQVAAKLPEVPITLLVLQIQMSFQKTILGFMTTYEATKCPAIMADVISCLKFKMADK